MRNEKSLPKTTFESTLTLIQENARDIKEFKEFMKKAEEERKKDKKEEKERRKAEEERKRVAEETRRVIEEERRKAIEEENRKFEASIKAIQQELGGISKSNGEVAEFYFLNSFTDSMYFAGQEYDKISHNLIRKSRKLNLQDEYDLVLYNCTSIVIIEIKYKARKDDVEKLMKKAETFKLLFPEYANFDIYLGLAAFYMHIAIEKESINQGIAVIKQVGKNMVVNDTHLKVF
jgi:hypothetical protein